ncbi:MAG: hypothetical protein ACI4SM_03395 [Candidatus Gastranaerophilaceae bacterium]
MTIAVILQICGFMFILELLILAIVTLPDFIANKIGKLKWKYKYKHRFNKPPLAKCYCKDCRYYIDKEDYYGDCWKYNYLKVTDSWYCCSAEPKSYDCEGSEK